MTNWKILDQIVKYVVNGSEYTFSLDVSKFYQQILKAEEAINYAMDGNIKSRVL